MVKLDDLVIANIKERLFTPDRLAIVLDSLLERRESQATTPFSKIAARLLQGELEAQSEDKLTRLYRAIEDGVVDLDGGLKDRITALKIRAGYRSKRRSIAIAPIQERRTPSHRTDRNLRQPCPRKN